MNVKYICATWSIRTMLKKLNSKKKLENEPQKYNIDIVTALKWQYLTWDGLHLLKGEIFKTLASLEKILNVIWWQHNLNKKILEKTKLLGMYILVKSNIICAGDLNGFGNGRLPKEILKPQLWEESYKTASPKPGQEYMIKRNLGIRSIPLGNWLYMSQNRKS